MKTFAHSYRLFGLVCALGTLHLVGACSSDEPGSSGDGGPDGATGTGGKATGGAAGRPSTGGSAGASGAGGASGAAACIAGVPTVCDGAEDCPSGQRCCGEYVMTTGYDKFGCYDSCGASEGGAPNPMAPLVFELCHAGDTCEDSTAQCLTSPFLPASLSRCLPAQLMGMAMGGPPNTSLGKDADRVNCGEAVCGAGEQCCVREPLVPYCAPAGATCKCDYQPPEGGVPEAGVPDASGPVPDASPPTTKDATVGD